MLRAVTALLASTTLLGCGGIAVIDGEDGTSGNQSSSKSSSATGGGNAVSVSLFGAIARANCQSPGDSLEVSFTLRFDNQSSQSVVVAIATASLTGEAGVTSFSVDPSATGPIAGGSTGSFDFEKVAGSASGTPACAWCNATDTQLELELVVDGKPLTPAFVEDIDSVSCVF